MVMVEARNMEGEDRVGPGGQASEDGDESKIVVEARNIERTENDGERWRAKETTIQQTLRV
jgi:hypothetical protein